jgi:hypothetical protein
MIDYDLGVNYHSGKAIVVANALSRRSHMNRAIVEKMHFNLCEEFDKINLRLRVNVTTCFLRNKIPRNYFK